MNEHHFYSSWKPGFYNFYGKIEACWFRNAFDKYFRHIEVQTLSRRGLTCHRGVKFWRVFQPVEVGDLTQEHTLLRNCEGDFSLGVKKDSKRKQHAKDLRDRIKYYNDIQDSLFEKTVALLRIKSKKRIDWLFDLVYNADEEDFDEIWEKYIR